MCECWLLFFIKSDTVARCPFILKLFGRGHGCWLPWKKSRQHLLSTLNYENTYGKKQQHSHSLHCNMTERKKTLDSSSIPSRFLFRFCRSLQIPAGVVCSLGRIPEDVSHTIPACCQIDFHTLPGRSLLPRRCSCHLSVSPRGPSWLRIELGSVLGPAGSGCATTPPLPINRFLEYPPL